MIICMHVSVVIRGAENRCTTLSERRQFQHDFTVGARRHATRQVTFSEPTSNTVLPELHQRLKLHPTFARRCSIHEAALGLFCDEIFYADDLQRNQLCVACWLRGKINGHDQHVRLFSWSQRGLRFD